MRMPILCADGTIISVQASSQHYCSPKSDTAYSYGAVEINITKPDDPEWNNGIDTMQGWVEPSRVLELINQHGGAIGGQLPPLNFGNFDKVEGDMLKWADQALEWWQARREEKESEEE